MSDIVDLSAQHQFIGLTALVINPISYNFINASITAVEILYKTHNFYVMKI